MNAAPARLVDGGHRFLRKGTAAHIVVRPQPQAALLSMAASTSRTLTDPAAGPSRIDALDILRGAALLGMILVHVHQRTGNHEATWPWYEDWIGWFIWLGVEQKSHGVFALLFGAGFAILLARAEARGQGFLAFYLRRMAGLAVFGILAEALFGFEILIAYAISGLWLLLLRRWSTPALLVVAVLAMMSGSIRAFLRDGQLLRSGGPEAIAAAAETRLAERRADGTRLHEAETGTSYATLVGVRAEQLRRYARPSAFVPGANLALFILGLLAIRHGVFTETRQRVRLITGFMLLGLASWAMYWLLLPRLPDTIHLAGVPVTIRWGLGLISDQWLAFTWAGGLTLLLAFRPVWTGRLGALGLTGRMALTNYFIQIMVIDVLASGYGFAIETRPFARVAITALLFAAQAGFSAWWLGRYRHGPLERVWRTVSYGK